MTEIRFDAVGKSFDRATAVADLTLTIMTGEFFTFVGPSGCGKSTVLNMIAGLEQVSTGTILFDGTVVNNQSPKERDVAMVFQSYALYPHMSVSENIAFPLRMRNADRGTIDREVRRIASLLGLADLLDRRPRELSGGQRQRVALGRAIVRRPRVFLLDEPLSNLDALLRVEMRAELKRLHGELGITMVYVTHDQSEALGLSDRMAVLDRGRVRQVGTPREVYRRPADRFVAGFIGSPPMNFIPARVTASAPLEIDCLGRRCAPLAGGFSAGREVVAGIRPEDLQALPAPAEETVEAAVLVAEPAGAVTWIEAQQGDVTVRAAAAPDATFATGNRVHLRFDPRDLLVFDATSGVLL
jgi:multiple sugar transport system ATP-binding protein